jgi:hypothetical protein
MTKTNQPKPKLEILRSVKVEELSIEMGVLGDGTPFLSNRGLAKACGISNGTLVGWGEFTPRIGDDKRAGKMARLLAAQGYQNERFFVRVPNGIQFGKEATISAYPDAVCMAFLEYYAFEAEEDNRRETALNNFRVLGRSQLRAFIYKATGYNPQRATLNSWQQFHDRLLLNPVPKGYFSVFQETAGVVVNAIRSGLIVDEHTVPDISMGQGWSRYWKSHCFEKDYGKRILHLHTYPEYFQQSQANGSIRAYIYPYAVLGEFRQWLDQEYIPNKFPSYLKVKVKEGAISSAQVNRLLKAIQSPELNGNQKTA